LYSKILVPIDLEEPSSWAKAVPVGLVLAKSFDATITLCTVVTDRVAIQEGSQWSGLSYEALLSAAQAKLGSLADELRGERAVDVRVGRGSISGGVLAIAEELGVDLIVVASHRPAMKDWLIGANASRIVRHARCSVLVVRE
jgi:nucleotide-binding universal stress UspA family protein